MTGLVEGVGAGLAKEQEMVPETKPGKAVEWWTEPQRDWWKEHEMALEMVLERWVTEMEPEKAAEWRYRQKLARCH